MIARDDVAALPGGAGRTIAHRANAVYTADPRLITMVANDLTAAAGTADAGNRAVVQAANGVSTWTGDVADSLKHYLSSFVSTGDAAHTALTAGAGAVAEAANALHDGRASLEQLFRQVLLDYRKNLSGCQQSHPTDAAREAAASAAVADHTAAITNQLTAINTLLGQLATEIAKIAHGFSPRFTALPTPGASRHATVVASVSRPHPGHHHAPHSHSHSHHHAPQPKSRHHAPVSRSRHHRPPPGNVRDWIRQAIRILEEHGIPVDSLNANDIWTIIQHESGGNPHLINRRDANARAGHPSKGLMQCVDSTFRAHALPGHGDIYNPVDNIIAGVRYALSRYGSIGNVPGVVAVHSGGHYVGY